VKTDPPSIDEKLWERLRHRNVLIKQHVLASVPESAGPLVADQVWQSFKQQCAAECNAVPLLISQLDPQDLDQGMFRRRRSRKPAGSDPFGDLPLIQRLRAEDRFRRLCEKWAGNLPSWRRAVLAGVARRLTLHPPDSEWGKRMRRIKGGVHCQRKYREQGWHPLAEYNQAMAKRRKDRAGAQLRTLPVPSAFQCEAEEARKRLGITAEQMRVVPRVTPLLASVESGVDRIIEALRWSREDDAIAFLQKYDSVPAADLRHLSIEEICVAAGVDPRRMLAQAADALLYISILNAKIQVAVSLPDITHAVIKRASAAGGTRDRRLFFQLAGLLPFWRVAPPPCVGLPPPSKPLLLPPLQD
jgi:hypothetical protein